MKYKRVDGAPGTNEVEVNNNFFGFSNFLETLKKGDNFKKTSVSTPSNEFFNKTYLFFPKRNKNKVKVKIHDGIFDVKCLNDKNTKSYLLDVENVVLNQFVYSRNHLAHKLSEKVKNPVYVKDKLYSFKGGYFASIIKDDYFNLKEAFIFSVPDFPVFKSMNASLFIDLKGKILRDVSSGCYFDLKVKVESNNSARQVTV